ncbi:MAG: NAD(P)-dependent oxidoreductase [Planctomycetes bacterium]|nr:NAD(P)-dependent oxidoreductase [Planctomycetota bacterium]
MRVLVTGSAGYTGSGMVAVIAGEHHVRGADIRPSEGVQESVVADITDLEVCRRITAGVEAVVMCHMAKNPDGYKTPVAAIDINLKGTANLYHAMSENGVPRAVLISSVAVLAPEPHPMAEPGVGPYSIACTQPKTTLYGITKVFQEQLACFYHATTGIVTTMLRPGWMVYEDKLLTKYGEKMERYYDSLIDPRDIGHAVLGALRLSDPRIEAFRISSDEKVPGMAQAMTRLNWKPRHLFAALPRVKE